MTELTRREREEQVKDNVAAAIVAFAKEVGAFQGNGVHLFCGVEKHIEPVGAAWETSSDIFIPWLKSRETIRRLIDHDVMLWEAKDGSFRLVDGDPLRERPPYQPSTHPEVHTCCFCGLGEGDFDEIEAAGRTLGSDAPGPSIHPMCRDYYWAWRRHQRAAERAFGSAKPSAA